MGRPVPSPYILPDGLSWVDLILVFSSVLLGWVDLRRVFSPGGWVGLICRDAPNILPISGWVERSSETELSMTLVRGVESCLGMAPNVLWDQTMWTCHLGFDQVDTS
jgi:hypothetical protein